MWSPSLSRLKRADITAIEVKSLRKGRPKFVRQITWLIFTTPEDPCACNSNLPGQLLAGNHLTVICHIRESLDAICRELFGNLNVQRVEFPCRERIENEVSKASIHLNSRGCQR